MKSCLTDGTIKRKYAGKGFRSPQKKRRGDRTKGIFNELEERSRKGIMPKDSIKIRTAQIEDARELLAVYAPYVEKTAVTFEYEVPSLAEFSERVRRTLEKYPYFIAECEGEIAGYAYAGSFHERAAYDWACEVSIYLRQDRKRQGIGRKLYDALEGTLKAQNIQNLYACIAYPDPEDEYLTRDSVRFHEHMGYHLIGEFHQCGYKFGRWYHMVWMEKHLGNHEADPKKVRPFREVIRDRNQ